jgi:hypothetical protein
LPYQYNCGTLRSSPKGIDTFSTNTEDSMELTFAQVEKALALTHNIADGRRSAFSSRLKHLQKLKFPPGINTGRGRAATYSVGHLFLLGVALELNQLGLSPERAADVITRNLRQVAEGGLIAARHGPPKGSFPTPVLLYFDPANLSDLMHSVHAEDRASRSFHFGELRQAAKEFSGWMRGGLHRMSFFSLSALLHNLAGYSRGDRPREDFYRGLLAWCQELVEGLQD